MSDFHIRLTTRNGTPVQTQLQLQLVRHSWHEEGGPDTAEIAVVGADNAEAALDFVGCKVTVLASDLTPVWWGLVEEVTVSGGGSEYGVSLADMANRISVIYSIATEGGAVTAQTAWAEDAYSIDLYGRKELLYSLGTATPDEAAKTLATLLATKRLPRLTVQASRNNGASGVLHCVGLWQSLDWFYLNQSAGRIVHAGENETLAILGWGFQSSQLVGFDARLDRIHELDAKFTTELQEGDRIAVTGSTSNNGSFTVTEKPQVDAQVTYAASAASFNPIDDIDDGGERLDLLKAGEMVRITNTANNNGYWFLKSVSPDHATLHPAAIVAESAGTVTLAQGNSIGVSEALTHEVPVPGTKFVTVQAHGVKIAQSFTVPAGGAAWAVGEVVVTIRKVGAPADAVKVEICANSGGAPGTVLDSATVTGTALPAKSAAAVTFNLNRTASLTPGATYWLVVSRTGAVHHANFYQVQLDKDAGYAGGSLRLWTGAAWETKTASLNFQVWGQVDAVTALADIVAAAANSGYLAGSSVRALAGVYSRRYKPGQAKALAEAQKLLSSGTASGGRLLATVNPDGIVIVDVAPTEAVLRWDGGKVVTRFGKSVPLGPLPVGQLVRFSAPQSARFSSDALRVIRAAEYDAANDTMTPDFEDTSVWNVGEAQQG